VIEYLCTAFSDATSGAASDREQLVRKIQSELSSPSQNLPTSTTDDEVSLVRAVSKFASASMDEFSRMTSSLASDSYMGSLARMTTSEGNYVSSGFASTVGALTLGSSFTTNSKNDAKRKLSRKQQSEARATPPDDKTVDKRKRAGKKSTRHQHDRAAI
jgi:hypothetical protein